IIDTSGQVLADSRVSYDSLISMENHRYRPEIISLAKGQKLSHNIRYSETVNTEMLYVASHLGQNNSLILRLARPLTDIEEHLSRWKVVLLVILLCSLFVIFLVIFFYSTRLKNVIDELGERTQKVGTDDLHTPQYLGFSNETDRLYDFMDDTSDRLRKLISDLVTREQEVRTLLRSVSEAVIAVDSNTNVLFANDNACKIFDSAFTSGNIPIIPLTGFAHEPKFADIVSRSFVSGQSVEEMVQYRNKNRDYELRVMSTIVKSDKNPSRSVALLTIVDITDEKRLAHAKAEFVEAASHELRTPLTILKGYVETLEIDDDPEMQKKALKKINHGVDRLEGLIHDLLQLSYLESGKATIKYSEVDSKRIVSEILSDVETMLKEKQVVAEFECDGLIFNSVPELIYIALFNLVTNAIKYNVQGGRVLVKCLAENGNYVIGVYDSGPGIPEEYREKVFERFFRIDKHRSRETGGTGLGLAIVKHIVNTLKGTIRITDGLDGGSAFIISLPNKK
ncbi:MAG: hypothetical protein JNL74_01900, partial [Fibrobacteres bacterium]|nr:hypothetical protein [Fibrobacterota bacterium]